MRCLIAVIVMGLQLLTGCASAPTNAPACPPHSPVNINQADFKVLETLPGIGPFYARLISEYRRKHGSFKDVNELRKIGLSQKGLDRLYFNCIIVVK